MEEEKDFSEKVETAEKDEKAKNLWQIQKESWYDKVPLTLKQLDMIIKISFVLLILTFVVIFLDAADIFNPFGY